jgi:phosphoribosylanthranilate isomerase
MTWIKICGITNLEDALTAVEAGADALGFVFYDKSPRNIDPELAREIVQRIPEHVERVGVFVGTVGRQELSIFNQVRLTAFQLYPFSRVGTQNEGVTFGEGCFWQTPKTFLSFPMGFFAEDDSRLESLASDLVKSSEQGETLAMQHQRSLEEFGFHTIFLDSGNVDQPGGTGLAFDWRKAAALVNAVRDRINVVVAGGLNADNVAESIAILRPWGVDVSSGVEKSPGKKDPDKIRAFVSAVRGAEQVQ